MKTFLKQHSFATIVGISLLLNGVAWVGAFLFPRQESTAILHYTSTVGIDFVGESSHIIVLPLAGLLILGSNLIVGRLIMEADQRAAWVLWSAMPLIQVILIIALLFLRSLN